MIHNTVPEGRLVSGDAAGIDSCMDALTRLRTMAATFSRPLPPAQSLIAVQVVFVAGTATPWRLVETVRFTTGPRRQMLCFDSLHRIWRCVEERLLWQRADEQFVARHMTTPGGFPGVTADWVHSKDFDAMFRTPRDAMRKEMCATSPRYTVTLS